MTFTEYQESSSITLEWTLKGLKSIFESSRGESKSKVTKSVRFGGGKWQVLFYANAGLEGGFVSLYLSCEPTYEEKDAAINGKWVREGLYKFSFELRNIGKSTLFNMKEACDHSFSYKTANWGWAQFSRRDAVFYQPASVRQADAFVIVCTITSTPSQPLPSSEIRKKAVPRDLLDMIGCMLDDPNYSDVEFVIPRKGGNGRSVRSIYAAKKMISRADYFRSMFNSGFAEMAPTSIHLPHGDSGVSSASPRLRGTTRHTCSDNESLLNLNSIEDSDEEDEALELDLDEPGDDEEIEDNFDETESHHVAESEDLHATDSVITTRTQSAVDGEPTQHARTETEDERGLQGREDGSVTGTDEDDELMKVVRFPSRGGSPATPPDTPPEALTMEPTRPFKRRKRDSTPVPGPLKTRVVITDVAYVTYRAVLYYLYTDTIVFAPLSSNFIRIDSLGSKHPFPSRAQSYRMPIENMGGENIDATIGGTGGRPKSQLVSALDGNKSQPTSRAEWIREWGLANPGRPLPCSAKAVYRLADKLDLKDLKERASQHIIKSLTVTNVPHEVFSSFSAAFDEIRKVQVDFFLANWSEIRGSEAMRHVWAQIRTGRHPGFEEVWPVIALSLDFKPRSGDGATGDEKDGAGTEL